MSGKMNRYVGGAAACLRRGTDALLLDAKTSGLESSVSWCSRLRSISLGSCIEDGYVYGSRYGMVMENLEQRKRLK